MSKKKKNNPVQSYILAIKSMSLASGMMVFGAACDSIKKEWPECEKEEINFFSFHMQNSHFMRIRYFII